MAYILVSNIDGLHNVDYLNGHSFQLKAYKDFNKKSIEY